MDVHWSVTDGMVELDWIESGGRKVETPSRAGFGSRLLGRAVAHEPDSSTRMEFDADGFRYRACWRAAAESQSPPVAAREPLTSTAA